MAAFSSLTDRLSNAFKHLKSKGKLSEADIDGTIREIRRALLDADVALDVVRSFTGRIRERALGTEEFCEESADRHHARRSSGCW